MTNGSFRRASTRDLATQAASIPRVLGDSAPVARPSGALVGSLPSLYGYALAELRRPGFFGAGTVAAVLGVGIGHAGLALSAGWVARSLVGSPGKLAGLGLATVCLIGLLASALKALAQVGLAQGQARLSAAVANRVRLEVASGLLAQGGAGTAQHLLARMAVRISEVEVGARAWVTLHRALAQLVPLLAALIFLSPLMAIGAVGVLVPFGVGVASLRKRWKRGAHEAQLQGERLHQHVDELVGNLDLFRTFGAGTRVLSALATAGASAGQQSARVDAFRAGLSGANEVLGALAVLGTVMLSERLGVGLGDGTLLAFAAVFFMAYRPLRDLGDGRSALVKGQAALESLDSLRGEPIPDARPFSWGNADLECADFGHAERGGRIGFRLPFGGVLWLRGANGSGKTTLLRCLLGLEASVGRVDYGERSLSGAAVGPSARPFAWVAQDAPMVTGTLLENVRLMGATEADAVGALDLLGAAWLRERVGGALLGPGGRAVSGGERRLIAVARAVATGQPVLLLDEPFVGLDAEARQRLEAALARLSGARSLVVVSHDDLPEGFAGHEVVLTPNP